MIYITSKHIIDAIKTSCPTSINSSIDKVELISESDKQFVCFKTSEGEQKFLCHWWITVNSEVTILSWRFPLLIINSIDL